MPTVDLLGFKAARSIKPRRRRLYGKVARADPQRLRACRVVPWSQDEVYHRLLAAMLVIQLALPKQPTDTPGELHRVHQSIIESLLPHKKVKNDRKTRKLELHD